MFEATGAGGQAAPFKSGHPVRLMRQGVLVQPVAALASVGEAPGEELPVSRQGRGVTVADRHACPGALQGESHRIVRRVGEHVLQGGSVLLDFPPMVPLLIIFREIGVREVSGRHVLGMPQAAQHTVGASSEDPHRMLAPGGREQPLERLHFFAGRDGTDGSTEANLMEPGFDPPINLGGADVAQFEIARADVWAVRRGQAGTLRAELHLRLNCTQRYGKGDITGEFGQVRQPHASIEDPRPFHNGRHTRVRHGIRELLSHS